MTRPPRPRWDFDYRPIAAQSAGAGGSCDVVLATEARVAASRLEAAFAAEGAIVHVEELLAVPPLFWLRVRGPASLDAAGVARIASALVAVRYASPTRGGSQAWAPPFALPFGAGDRPPPAWRTRAATSEDEPLDSGRWFLSAEGGGVAANRSVTGTGAGTRLAVIDDDAAGAEALDLDAEVLVGIERRPSAQSHGALMVSWAAGAPRAEPPFRGVAPDTSPRLYLLPKPGAEVVSLPIAIVRAVADGADVIVCATYIDGAWSPMLDDAIAFAERAGRGGLGTVIVLPTSRETSSPPGSIHASMTLSFGDPAADPRVLCAAPAARGGGWFFYRDRKKLARPFANRGPSVRLLAPGDDVAYPLGGAPRLTHAESSGASAIAAGVVLLVLANNPMLTLRDVLALVEATASDVDPAPEPAWAPLADPHDTLPATKDRDGHNAKHGYGALHAERACLAAADPIAWALVRIGEDRAAALWCALRREDPVIRAAYSDTLGQWTVRVLLADARASHAVRALVRHARLLSLDPRRVAAFPPGAFAKQVALVLRGFLEGTAIGLPPKNLRAEIEATLAHLVCTPLVDNALHDLARRIFAATASVTRV